MRVYRSTPFFSIVHAYQTTYRPDNEQAADGSRPPVRGSGIPAPAR